MSTKRKRDTGDAETQEQGTAEEKSGSSTVDAESHFVNLTGADLVAEMVNSYGCTVVFGMTGGYVQHSVHAVGEHPNLTFVTCHNEQAASLAADGYFRVSGNPGVCMGISGPGGINLLQVEFFNTHSRCVQAK